MKSKSTSAIWHRTGDLRQQRSRLTNLRKRANSLARRGDFYPSQVKEAQRFVEYIITGCRAGVIIRPPQSGKTGIIGAITVLVREIFGDDIACVLVIANDQLDLRAQNMNRLEHLNVEVLTQSDRRHWKGHGVKPLLVIYDESHFGDGKDMTIDRYFQEHGVKENPNILFCGVSATPYASQNTLDFDIWPDMKKLESEEKYNSPSVMLSNGRIKESEPLFAGKGDTLRLLKENEVYKHIQEVMSRPVAKGYGMIRCSTEQASLLKDDLNRLYGRRLFIKDWNMKSPIIPSDFFSQPRFGVFTLVLVQHKARMGTTIDTGNFEFFFEYSEKPKIDTIAQSFMGRASGYGKTDHKAIVYTKKRMAEAYSMFIESNGDGREMTRFALFTEKHGLDPAMRAKIQFKASDLKTVKFGPYHGNTSIDKVIKQKILKAVAKMNLHRKDGSIRRLSRQSWVTGKAGRKAAHPSLTSSLRCGPNPGDWALLIFDEYEASTGLKKDWPGIIAMLAIRTDGVDAQGTVEPSDGSIFDDVWGRGRAAQ